MKLLVKIDDQSYEVEVGDLNVRPVLATIDGEVFEVWPEEAQAAAPALPAVKPAVSATPVPAPAAGAAHRAPSGEVAAAPAADRNKSVTAPIPGTIVSIAIKEGDAVNPAQELCALEAMKMKNIIRATRAARIARVLIKVGDRVTQGQPLVEYAE
jgi:glutaconyl-CoA/methylmalonyl-CoA decarboxylase subunit gamma